MTRRLGGLATTSVETPSPWSLLVGDPAVFAVRLTLLPDDEPDPVDPDEAASWGSFELWAGGQDLCAHTELGEELPAVHWYLLGLLEWLPDNWGALFHEERLPLSNRAADAAATMSQLMAIPPDPALVSRGIAQDAEGWIEEWQAWWERHNIRAAAEGGLFPDVYLRRWGDLLEVSVGTDRQAGTPEHVVFRAASTSHLPLVPVATALQEAGLAAAKLLAGRRPTSARLRTLVASWESLSDIAAHRLSRLLWLSGADGWSSELSDLRQRLGESDASSGTAPSSTTRDGTSALVLQPAPALAAVFGSYRPDVTREDVVTLLSLGERGSSPGSDGPAAFTGPSIDLDERLSPGEQGSSAGDEAHAILLGDAPAPVDVHAVYKRLGVRLETVALSDAATRGVAVLDGGGAATVAVNSRYERGQGWSVVRSTLAHELGHLLLDRDRAVEVAVASGPWAPLEVEQRAGAFGAAFLMPSTLLNEAVAGLADPLHSAEAVQALAGQFEVSKATLVARLYNLGWLDRHQAEELGAHLAG